MVERAYHHPTYYLRAIHPVSAPIATKTRPVVLLVTDTADFVVRQKIVELSQISFFSCCYLLVVHQGWEHQGKNILKHKLPMVRVFKNTLHFLTACLVWQFVMRACRDQICSVCRLHSTQTRANWNFGQKNGFHCHNNSFYAESDSM